MTPDAAAQLDVSARNVIEGDSRSRGDVRVGEPDHPRLNYRPELDGIRGLAIALVVAFHFDLWRGNLGAVGVTVFFVLSGYLITQILLEERRSTGRVDFRAFYVRRARRLLPALFLLLAVILGFSIAVGQFAYALPGLLGATFYVANWVGVAGFDLGRLAHTWSLSVEEQFYLWWPITLVVVVSRRPRWLLPITLGGAIVLAFVAAAGAWSPLDRASPLLLGCALALVGRLPVARLLAAAGALLLVALTVLPDQPTALVPMIGAASVMLLGGVIWDRRLGELLSFAPLAWLGRISYSLYLWHYVVAYPHTVPAIVGIGLSVGLACASYYLVEARFRRPRSAVSVPVNVPAVRWSAPEVATRSVER